MTQFAAVMVTVMGILLTIYGVKEFTTPRASFSGVPYGKYKQTISDDEITFSKDGKIYRRFVVDKGLLINHDNLEPKFTEVILEYQINGKTLFKINEKGEPVDENGNPFLGKRESNNKEETNCSIDKDVSELNIAPTRK